MDNSSIDWIGSNKHRDRLASYKIMDAYYKGDMDVDIPSQVKAALEHDLGTKVNMSRIVVDIPVDYILGGDIGIEARENPKAEAFLYDVYDRNYMLDEELIKLLTITCKSGDGFIRLYWDEGLEIEVLRPELVFPRYRSASFRHMDCCVVKSWERKEKGGVWIATAYYSDKIEHYELASHEHAVVQKWKFLYDEKNSFGFIPIVHVRNTIDGGEYGISDLEVMLDIQDAMNKTITDMLVVMDNQAFQRVFAFGVQTPKGHKINMSPGMVTEVPVPEGHLDVVPNVDIDPYLSALKYLVRMVVTLTGLTQLAIAEDVPSHPQSGFALRVSSMPLERKCGKKQAVLNNRLRELNSMIFKAAAIYGLNDYVGVKTRIHFTGGLPVDIVSELQVDEMELRNNIRSRESVMERRGVEDVKLEMEKIRLEELSSRKLLPESD